MHQRHDNNTSTRVDQADGASAPSRSDWFVFPFGRLHQQKRRHAGSSTAHTESCRKKNESISSPSGSPADKYARPTRMASHALSPTFQGLANVGSFPKSPEDGLFKSQSSCWEVINTLLSSAFRKSAADATKGQLEVPGGPSRDKVAVPCAHRSRGF